MTKLKLSKPKTTNRVISYYTIENVERVLRLHDKPLTLADIYLKGKPRYTKRAFNFLCYRYKNVTFIKNGNIIRPYSELVRLFINEYEKDAFISECYVIIKFFEDKLNNCREDNTYFNIVKLMERQLTKSLRSQLDFKKQAFAFLPLEKATDIAFEEKVDIITALLLKEFRQVLSKKQYQELVQHVFNATNLRHKNEIINRLKKYNKI